MLPKTRSVSVLINYLKLNNCQSDYSFKMVIFKLKLLFYIIYLCQLNNMFL
jgi:hypothetical protein